MSKPDILQIGPYPAWDVEALEARFTMHRYFEADDKAAFVRERADRIRGIATRGELGAGRDLIDALPNLEVIAVYGVGYDAVDIAAAKARGIRVTNTPDVLTKDVADFGVAMMLAASRGIVPGEAWVRSGSWAAQGLLPLKTRVHGKAVGILGMGRIGHEVARRCAAFDMDIAYTDLAPRDGLPTDWTFVSDPVALAQRADVLFVTLTGGAATRGIVGRDVLHALGPSGLLVNIARASTVDEGALLEALETKALGFAALDVFENEPNLDPRFLTLDSVLLQPHQASGTVETRKAMGKLVHDNLAAHFAGQPLLTPVI
ncbi:2-hydroxyacid dehydrogenase [Roseospira marina]|uniref:2-hydroxyacid dehydrogenase n=1 Tax=Roseospira marina TaxID=140057 RepID=A0A5M6IAM1_9PROT|nr:2-hydroxyacid dehydrogenase [Roseospira marina]KAA5605314.1 2-hydroxyacid dehydrogenase [Roseospira marina]MBB4314782.1 lactate dehydrogenase-like 2-hydroxyacid dehydrogenase [Roseospira marina]MBB5087771.1 lactate dehydrogenase-like 2-hydroxyacid dehydrogenase [Roseospira marina]